MLLFAIALKTLHGIACHTEPIVYHTYHIVQDSEQCAVRIAYHTVCSMQYTVQFCSMV